MGQFASANARANRVGDLHEPALFEEQLENPLDKLMLTFGILERRNMGVRQTSVDGLALGDICRTRQQRVVMRQVVLPFELRVEVCVNAKPQQVLLPLWAPATPGHAGTDKRNHKAAFAGAFHLIEASQIACEQVGVQDACFLFLIEPLGFWIVEIAVAEVKSAARLGERDFLVAAFADDLGVLELLIVDHLVEAAVLADADDFF
jgi:hypothetical protein